MIDDRIAWLPEARVQALCGIARPTWKSWARAGLIEEDRGGAYDERQVLDVALVATLREHLGPGETRTALRALERDGRRNDLLDRARELTAGQRFDLVIEPSSLAVRLATDDATLVAAIRHPADPRPVLVLPIADRLRRIRDGFHTMALRSERPRERKLGRPARAAGETS